MSAGMPGRGALIAAFAAVLSSLREERGLSRVDLAQLADVDVVTLQDMEGGQHEPQLREFVALAEGLRVTLAEFLQLIASLAGGDA